MSATARAAWLDAWEGPSTPSPFGYRESGRASAEWGRSSWPGAHNRLDTDCADDVDWADETDDVDLADLTGPVVRMSAARAHKAKGFGKWGAKRGTAKQGSGDDTRCRNMHIPEVPAIEHYDWDAAARRRPGTHEYERVILHADRTAEARMTSTHYYSRGATGRASDPWADAKRRQQNPQLRVVKYRVPRWRLGLVAAVFGLLVVSLSIVAPVMMSSSVASLEAAVGQAEAQQEELSADTAALAAQISSLSSPQRVAEEAEQLGLIPANQVSYVPSDTPALAGEGDTTVAGR